MSIMFHALLAKSLEKIKKDNNLSLAFLKGYEVGDGSINVRNGCLHDINITVKDRCMKDYLILLFYNIYGVKFLERKNNNAYEIRYGNVIGMIDLVIDRHFEDLDRQWSKFIGAYKNKEYIRSHLRYWKVLQRPRTVKYIFSRTDRSHWSVRDALNRDQRVGLISATYRMTGKASPPYKLYSLTDKGKLLVNVLNGD